MSGNSKQRVTVDAGTGPLELEPVPIAVGLKAAAIGLLTLLMAILVACHTPGLNGPSYWQWHWRQLSLLQATLGFGLAFLPFAFGQYLYSVRKSSASVSLLPVMLSFFSLELVAIGLQATPFSLDLIPARVMSPDITGYFTDATLLLDSRRTLSQWLADFPKLSGSLHPHSQTHPPGPILFYAAFLSLFGASGDRLPAILAGLSIAILATSCIPATYMMIRTLTGRRDRGFHGASFLALSPGMVLFLPEFDQVYPALACLILTCWAISLERQSVIAGAACGAALALACFFTYSLLTLGTFLIGLTLLLWLRAGRPPARKILGPVLAVASSFAIANGAIWILAGFNPVQTFAGAIGNQANLLKLISRPYPATILFDLTDFALGTGWIGFTLALFGLSTRKDPYERKLNFLCFAQILIVASLGLLAGETARVWMFLLPLFLIPLDGELASWPASMRLGVYACATLILAVISSNMVFIS